MSTHLKSIKVAFQEGGGEYKNSMYEDNENWLHNTPISLHFFVL